MEFHKMYRHVGFSYPAVPEGWEPIVKRTIVLIEKEIWPGWMPLPVKWLSHWLANYKWAYWLRQSLTDGQVITEIKEKFATLRVYGLFGKEIDKLVREAETACDKTCQQCGSTDDVKTVDVGWLYNLCAACSHEKKFRKR